MDALRFQYLEAIGIPVWVGREQAATASPVLRLGPGSSGVLFICQDGNESASPLASDICRTLAEPPVWAWPENEGEGVSIGDAIRGNLFTSVLVFGKGLANQVFASAPPQMLAQARIVVLPGLAEIAASSGQRRACWRALSGGGLARILHKGGPENS